MQLLPLLVAGLAVAAPTTLSPRDTCNTGVRIITARGTFEPQGIGLQQTITDAILAKIPNSNASAVIYPASPSDIVNSVASGVANAQQQITDYYNACPNGKMVLMGYSQGAQVIGDSVSGGGTALPGGGNSEPTTPISQAIGANVISIVQFGDPNRNEGQGADNAPNPCKATSSSPRSGPNKDAMQFYASKLDEYCDLQDPVCCANGYNVLAHLGYFNSANANAIAAFVAGNFS